MASATSSGVNLYSLLLCLTVRRMCTCKCWKTNNLTLNESVMVDRTAQSSRAMCVETTQCVQTKTTHWAFAASAQLISTTFLDLTTV